MPFDGRSTLYYCRPFAIFKHARRRKITATAAKAQTGFDLAHGSSCPCRFLRSRAYRPSRIFISAHHLVIQGVSWRIILEDLADAYKQALNSREPVPLTKDYVLQILGRAYWLHIRSKYDVRETGRILAVYFQVLSSTPATDFRKGRIRSTRSTQSTVRSSRMRHVLCYAIF